MKPIRRAPLAIFSLALAVVGTLAVANLPAPLPTPSSRLAIEVDVKPVAGQAGRFMVTSAITDLESGNLIAQPKLMIDSDKPARVETGTDGQWKLAIGIAAGSASRKAAFEATFTREGQVVSKQRFAVDLNG